MKNNRNKVDGRVYNFTLPEELRDYLIYKAQERYTSVSQLLINYIIKEKDCDIKYNELKQNK